MTDPWPIDLCHPSKFNFLVGREIGTGTFNWNIQHQSTTCSCAIWWGEHTCPLLACLTDDKVPRGDSEGMHSEHRPMLHSAVPYAIACMLHYMYTFDPANDVSVFWYV